MVVSLGNGYAFEKSGRTVPEHMLLASASAPVAGPPAPGSSPASWWRDPAVMAFQEPLTDSALCFQADLREVLLETGRYQPAGDVQKDADACDPASSGVATVTRLDARVKACWRRFKAKWGVDAESCFSVTTVFGAPSTDARSPFDFESCLASSVCLEGLARFPWHCYALSRDSLDRVAIPAAEGTTQLIRGIL